VGPAVGPWEAARVSVGRAGPSIIASPLEQRAARSAQLDLRRVLQDALDVIEPIASEKSISIVAPERESVQLHADPDLLKQLTVNLLENAVKFSKPGGRVALDFEREASSVRITVTDEGPGIAADKLDLIFHRFYQVDGSNSRAHGGSGLGLAICRSIATWHDGRIWAESELGKGARFVVSLPKIRATSRERAAKPVLDTQQPDTHVLPELIIEMVSEMMCAETVSLMLVDGDELFIQAAMGIPDEAIREVRMAIGDRIAGSVAKSGETLHIPDLTQDERFGPPAVEDQYRTRSLLSVPVKVRGKVIGVINATNKTSGLAFSDHDRRLLEMFAQRVALMLNKIREFGDQREGVERMEEAIRGVIDVRRHYFSSDEQVTNLILETCQVLGLSEEDMARIHYAWILKDVGMMRLPDGVYKKPSELTSEDWELVRRHPEEGAKVLRSIEFQPEVFDMVMFHHEEIDGSGYPRGLTDAGIPIGAKVLAVVDAYNALRSGRPYRKAADAEAAVDEIRRNGGLQFDPSVVEALIQVLESRGELRVSAKTIEGESKS
jgi:response regulator RpfG family c-di-GMP phosphodiesterase